MSESRSLLLVNRFRAGDTDAARILFEEFAAQLTELVSRRLSPKLARRFDAEDVVQSAFRSFLSGIPKGEFTLGRSGDVWRVLVGIALHKLYGQIKRHQAACRDIRREAPAEPAPNQGNRGANGRVAAGSGKGEPHELLAAALAREPSPEEAAVVLDELAEYLRGQEPRHRSMVAGLMEELWADLDRYLRGLEPRDSQIVAELFLQTSRYSAVAAKVGCSEHTVRRVWKNFGAQLQVRLQQ